MLPKSKCAALDFSRILWGVSMLLYVCLPFACIGDGGENLLSNPGFSMGAKGWQKIYDGFKIIPEPDGNNVLCMESDSFEKLSGAVQKIVFDTAVQGALEISCRSKCEGVETGFSFPIYYAIRLDCVCVDGTEFNERTLDIPYDESSDWHEHKTVIFPPKPIKELKTQILFWHNKGKVYFDDVKVCKRPMSIQYFNIMPNLFGKGNVEVRAFGRYMESWSLDVSYKERNIYFLSGSGASPVRVSIPANIWARGENTIVPENATLRFKAHFADGSDIEENKHISFNEVPEENTYAVWCGDSMERMFPSSLPERPLSKMAEVVGARNEYVSFQIGILSPGSLKNIKITVPALKSDDGAELEPSCSSIYQVGCVFAKDQQLHPSITEAESVPDWFPDVLMKAESFDVEASWAQPVLTRIHIPESAVPGIYSGNIIIHPGNSAPQSVSVKLRVYPFALPEHNSLKTAFTNHSRFQNYRYFRQLYPGADYEDIARRVDKFLLEYRIEPFWKEPVQKIADMSEEDQNLMKEKATAILLGDISVDVKSDSAENESAFQKKCADMRANLDILQKLNIAEKAYIYGFDELAAAHSQTAGKYFKQAKELFPGIPTLSTIRIKRTAKEMEKISLDEIVVFLPFYSYEEVEQIRRDGKKAWAYVMAEFPSEYPQFNMHNPLIDSRLLFWMAYQQKFDGLLYWGSCIWSDTVAGKNERPIDPANGPRVNWNVSNNCSYWVYGDGRLSYPGIGESPMGSLRMVNICDGLQDYEYLKILEDKKGKEAAMAEAKKIVSSTRLFSRNPEDIRRTRREIADLIMTDAEQ